MENSSRSSRNEDCDDPKLQWDRVMTGKEWLNYWETNNIGFHKKDEHQLLKKHLDIFVNGRKELRIFFPLCGKAVEMKCSVTGHFEGIWDRGSLVAVNPSERERYAQLILSLMNRMCRCLLVTMSYDVRKHKGPPFYVSDSDVKSLFGKACDIQCLEKVYCLEERHKKWGLDYLWEVLYLVTLKEPR